MLGHQFSTKHTRISPSSVVDTVTFLGLHVMTFQRLIQFFNKMGYKTTEYNGQCREQY